MKRILWDSGLDEENGRRSLGVLHGGGKTPVLVAGGPGITTSAPHHRFRHRAPRRVYRTRIAGNARSLASGLRKRKAPSSGGYSEPAWGCPRAWIDYDEARLGSIFGCHPGAHYLKIVSGQGGLAGSASPTRRYDRTGRRMSTMFDAAVGRGAGQRASDQAASAHRRLTCPASMHQLEGMKADLLLPARLRRWYRVRLAGGSSRGGGRGRCSLRCGTR